MNSLFETSNPQVEILNFQTFTTEYVAERYGTSVTNIRDHKREHADEIVEGIHFVVETNKFRKPVTKWTLRGIIKLGMFIRSNESKAFRIWAERELEKIILDAKDRQNQINGYKGQLAKHNSVIASLKNELAKRGKIYDAEVIERYEQKEENLRAMLHNAKAERDFYFKRTQELKQKQNVKDSEIVRILNKIQIQMDGVYSEIGAVMAYANDNDRFFIEHNQFLKG